MRDGARYLLGAAAGAVLAAAGFLVSGWPTSGTVSGPEPDGVSVALETTEPPGLPAHTVRTSEGPAGGLSGNPQLPSAEESAFLERALHDERRRRVEAVIRPDDTGLQVSRRIHDEKADAANLLADFDKFASHVGHAEGKATSWKGGDGLTKVERGEAEGSVVLEFGAGVFELNPGNRKWGEFREGVKAIEIRGAGMDATTVRIADTLLLATKGIESVRMHGVTWELMSSSATVLNTRGDVAIVCEDVRFRGVGESHVSPFYLEGYSYLGFRRCEFESLTVHGGHAVRLRGDVVALFKECTFRDLIAISTDAGTVRRGVVRLESCDFEGARLADAWSLNYRGQPALSIVVSGGNVAFGEPGQAESRRRSDWGAPLATRVDGTVFVADPSVPTVADMVRVLSAAAAESRLTPMHVSPRSIGRTNRPATYRVVVWDGKKKEAAWLATVGPGGVHVTADPNGEKNFHHEARLPSIKPLLEVLGSPSLPRNATARGAHYQTWFTTAGAPVLVVRPMSDAWPGWMIDAVTGEVVSRPEVDPDK